MGGKSIWGQICRCNRGDDGWEKAYAWESLAASLGSLFCLSGIGKLLPREGGNRKQCSETWRCVGDVETWCSVPNTEISFLRLLKPNIYKLHL